MNRVSFFFLEEIALIKHWHINLNEKSNKYKSSDLTYQSLNRALRSTKYSIYIHSRCAKATLLSWLGSGFAFNWARLKILWNLTLLNGCSALHKYKYIWPKLLNILNICTNSSWKYTYVQLLWTMHTHRAQILC